MVFSVASNVRRGRSCSLSRSSLDARRRASTRARDDSSSAETRGAAGGVSRREGAGAYWRWSPSSRSARARRTNHADDAKGAAAELVLSCVVAYRGARVPAPRGVVRALLRRDVGDAHHRAVARARGRRLGGCANVANLVSSCEGEASRRRSPRRLEVNVPASGRARASLGRTPTRADHPHRRTTQRRCPRVHRPAPARAPSAKTPPRRERKRSSARSRREAWRWPSPTRARRRCGSSARSTRSPPSDPSSGSTRPCAPRRRRIRARGPQTRVHGARPEVDIVRPTSSSVFAATDTTRPGKKEH